MSDRYYEPPSDNDDYADFFPCRVGELLDTEYNPADYNNFSEAICEAKQADREIIEEMLNKPHADIDFETLGRKLWAVAFAYMENYAESRAQEDWHSGYRD